MPSPFPIGSGAPWSPLPPTVVFPIGYDFTPGQLPGETGDTGGDTQVGYPADTEQPGDPTGVEFAASTPVTVTYIESGASPNATSEGHGVAPIRIYLGAGAVGPIVPGSLRFTFRGRTYVDRSGALHYDVDPTTNVGTPGGTIDYSTCTATLTEYGAGTSNTVSIVSMLTRYLEPGVSGVMFRTTGAPLKTGSFTLAATTIDGTQLTATVDSNGAITGTKIKGHVDWTTGLARVAFGELVTAAGNESQPWYDAELIDDNGKIWRPTLVDPGTVKFGTVILSSIPIDPTLIGIDPVRLPSDGRVLGYNPGTLAVVSHTQTTTLTPEAGAETDLGRERISFIDVLDKNGTPIESVWYTVDLDAGTVTWADPLNLSAYTMPVTIRDRIQDVRLIADVQITGEITLAAGVTHDYPSGAIVSNAVLFNDRQARVANLFDQATYQAGVWSDEVAGTPAEGTYNAVTYPIAVQNSAAIDERWAIVFASSTTVDVIGETVGQVLTGVSITSDIAPVNPVTVTEALPGGKPYFTLDADGFGGGWATGNVIRFNTVSATAPIWAARVVVPGDLEHDADYVRAQIYGNAH